MGVKWKRNMFIKDEYFRTPILWFYNIIIRIIRKTRRYQNLWSYMNIYLMNKNLYRLSQRVVWAFHLQKKQNIQTYLIKLWLIC